MLQDRLLEPLEIAARLDAELLDERLARRAKRLERVGLAAGAVEREHQMGPQRLAVGILGNERLQLGHELRVAAEPEVGDDQVLDHRQAKLFESRDRSLGRAMDR